MSNLPDISIDEIREDFEAIWELNKMSVVLQRESELEAGNYGYDDEISITTTSVIELNIQGINSHISKDALQGIITSGKTFKAYARYSDVLYNDDKIILESFVFNIKDLNKSYKDGQIAFQEFNLIGEGKNG